MQQSGDSKLLKNNQSGVCMPQQRVMTTHYIIHVDRMLQDLRAVQPNLDELKSRTSTAHIKTRKTIWPARILTAAASIAILLCIGTLVFTTDNNQPATYANDVNSGSDKAFLTLFNETKIKLSDTRSSSWLSRLSIEIEYAEDSILVFKEASNSNTLANNRTTTSKCSHYKNVLSDGT